MDRHHYAEISRATGTVCARLRSGGLQLSRTGRALELLEFNHGKAYAPVYYFPREDIDFSRLVKNEDRTTHCPIKGDASYYSLKTEKGQLENIAWSYEDPLDPVKAIGNYLGFDGGQVEIIRDP